MQQEKRITTVITCLNEKGGVGKTALAVNAAAGLAARGHQVLLIDADEQGHATLSLGMTKWPGLYDFLVRTAPIKDVLRAIDPGKYGGAGLTRLYLIGSNVETRNIANSISNSWALADRVAELAPMFEYVVIDTAPTPSLLHGAIYLATDFIVYPTECEHLSFDGLAESLTRLQTLRRLHGTKASVAGIVPNKVRGNTLEHQENLKALRAEFRDLVWTPISQAIVWAEAAAYALPVFMHAPESAAASAVWEIVDKVEKLNHG